MNASSFLPLTATIAPGATARVSTRLRSPFRPERLLISPFSFSLPLVRRLWTWFPVTIGNGLGRVHRGLARLLHVDLYPTHEQLEHVSLDYKQTHPEEVVLWDEEADRPFILVPTPLNRRGRLLAPLGRAARSLALLRLRWQQAQLSTLRIGSITIATKPPVVDNTVRLSDGLFDKTVHLSADLFRAGDEFEIEVHNGNHRQCQLIMALIGVS